MKSARAGEVNVLESGLDVVPGLSPLEIVYAQDAGVVTGTVLDPKGNRVSGGVLTVTPEPMNLDRLDRYRLIAIQKDGSFRVSGFRPGEYRLFAWDRIDGSYMDPVFPETIRGSKREGDGQSKIKSANHVDADQCASPCEKYIPIVK